MFHSCIMLIMRVVNQRGCGGDEKKKRNKCDREVRMLTNKEHGKCFLLLTTLCRYARSV